MINQFDGDYKLFFPYSEFAVIASKKDHHIFKLSWAEMVGYAWYVALRDIYKKDQDFMSIRFDMNLKDVVKFPEMLRITHIYSYYNADYAL